MSQIVEILDKLTEREVDAIASGDIQIDDLDGFLGKIGPLAGDGVGNAVDDLRAFLLSEVERYTQSPWRRFLVEQVATAVALEPDASLDG